MGLSMSVMKHFCTQNNDVDDQNFRRSGLPTGRSGLRLICSGRVIFLIPDRTCPTMCAPGSWLSHPLHTKFLFNSSLHEIMRVVSGRIGSYRVVVAFWF